MPRAKGSPKTGGRTKGTPNRATITKEQAREALRQIVLREMDAMTAAQIAHAKGVSYMVLRKSDGTYARATDAKQIDAACAAGSMAFQIFTQAPNTQAFTDLMNRALDKPKEQAQEIAITGEVEVLVRKLAQARQRGKS